MPSRGIIGYDSLISLWDEMSVAPETKYARLNLMSRILEYQRSDQATVVSRILLELHRTVDKEFPTIKAGSKQFTKTVLTSATSLETKSQTPGVSEPVEQGPKDSAAKSSVQQSTAPQSPTYASKASSSPASSVSFPWNSQVASKLDSELGSSAIQNTRIDSSTLKEHSIFRAALRLVLSVLLITGISVLAWLLVKGPELPSFLK